MEGDTEAETVVGLLVPDFGSSANGRLLKVVENGDEDSGRKSRWPGGQPGDSG
jgi:hypothetical protein